MEVWSLHILAVLCASTVSIEAWDVAVAVENRIQFLKTSGAVVGNVSEGMAKVRSLAYNDDLRRMYFSDNDREDGSIFSLTVPSNADLEAGNHTAQVFTVVKKQVHPVFGVVYDDRTGILYWSNGPGHSIMWVRVGTTDQPQDGQPLIKDEDQIPMGIAIDNCKRYLYWTNLGKHPSIERSLLDGSERETLVFTDPALPNAIVVDQKTDRLYWAAEQGSDFRIESVNLNRKDRRVVIEGSDHQPFALAVAGGLVFWADHIHTSLWSLALDHPAAQPARVAQYTNTPLALVSAYPGVWTRDKCNDVIEPTMKIIPATVTKVVTQSPVTVADVHAVNPVTCLNKGTYLPDRRFCECLPGFSGELCEINECLDYCVRGECHYGSRGKSCTCEKGYTGDRCEISVCHNYCVTGSCSIDLQKGTPQCHCQAGFSGSRCEIDYTHEQEMKDNLQQVCHTYCRLWALHAADDEVQPFQVCSCPAPSREGQTVSQWRPDYTLMALLALCSVLMVVVAVLTRRVLELRRRPRIKKRIIVNKNAQSLTSRPTSPDGGQCEITIENCCNMNICETPCFEPDFRQPEATLSRSCKEGKEEKRGLLGNMELPPDDLY